jgi:hypothetical protein
MKPRSRLPPASSPLPVSPVGIAPAPIRGDAVARSPVVMHLNSHGVKTKHASLTKLMKCLGSGRFAQAFFKAPSIKKNDPYLLLLLAEQELDEGREEQARYLVEAAYEAFDQQKESRVYRLYPVG